MAEALRKWLPRMNQLVRPWMSEQDIGAGSIWFQETLRELKEAKFGIICLTSDNLAEPWIHFEAGALLDIVGEAHICPYLLNIDESDIKGPLSHFQAKRAVKENSKEMLLAISAIGNDIDKEIIEESFERIWPDLDNDFNLTRDISPGTEVLTRDTSDMLQELLELVREQSRLNPERRMNKDQQERAQIIIKILKEGIYGTLGEELDLFSSVTVDFSGVKMHNREIRKRLESELLGMALKDF
jgi:hypothetical protein